VARTEQPQPEAAKPRVVVVVAAGSWISADRALLLRDRSHIGPAGLIDRRSVDDDAGLLARLNARASSTGPLLARRSVD
jgi:hypothetical protein